MRLWVYEHVFWWRGQTIHCCRIELKQDQTRCMNDPGRIYARASASSHTHEITISLMAHRVNLHRPVTGTDNRNARLTLLVRLLPVIGSGSPNPTASHYYLSEKD